MSAAERSRDILLQKRDALFAELADKLGRPVDMSDLDHVPWLAETSDRFSIEYPRTEIGKPSFTAGSIGWMHRHAHWFPQLVATSRDNDNDAVNFLERHVLDTRHGRIDRKFVRPDRRQRHQSRLDSAIASRRCSRCRVTIRGSRHWCVACSCPRKASSGRRLMSHSKSFALSCTTRRTRPVPMSAERSQPAAGKSSRCRGGDCEQAQRNAARLCRVYGAGVGKFAATIGNPTTMRERLSSATTAATCRSRARCRRCVSGRSSAPDL